MEITSYQSTSWGNIHFYNINQFLSIVYNGITLYPIPYPIKLATPKFILGISLNISGLLIGGHILNKQPHILPNVYQPKKEQIILLVRTLFPCRRSCEWILHTKEVTEQLTLWFGIWIHTAGNEVITINVFNRLWIQLVLEFNCWWVAIKDKGYKECRNIYWGCSLIPAITDVPHIACIEHLCLHGWVSGPILKT